MKRIMVLSDNCYSNAGTNGICASNLVCELRKNGYEVALIGYGEKTTVIETSCADGDFRVRYEKSVNSNVSKICIIKNAMKSIVRPLYNENVVKTYFNFACELIERFHYDVIVSVYYPIICTVVAMMLKRKYPNITIINYELDSATDGIVRYGKITKYQINATKRWFKKAYKCFDNVFIMKSHEEHVKAIYGDVLGDKLIVSDLPVLQDKIKQRILDGDKTVFIYAGLLDNRYRSPEILFKLFFENRKQENWQLHFYSKGNCEKDIEEAVKKDKRIFQHGYVSTEELDKSVEEAHILISIGNAQSRSVPSKLITYMSYGKPIIHFSLQEEDVCAEYLQKYPLALVIKNKEAKEKILSKISEFVDQIKNKQVSYEDLRDLFPMNLPEYSTNIIIDKLL